MKSSALFLAIVLAGTVSQQTPAAVITVTTTDNGSGPGDADTSLLEALQTASDGDTIGFRIPGAGPHFLQTPLGGYPLITANNLTIDGYSQPGSAPNTNPILGGNNAQIKIVLDSTGTDSGPTDPQDPTLNSRRSTRILHSGYGDTENGILAVFGADNFTVKGLSFIARHAPVDDSTDPAIYCVALVNQATNARVQGCWFGLAPGGSTQADIKPASAAVAAFRYRTGGDVYSEGLIVGTDGDGVDDRSEFNVILGCHIPLALELPRARISGNYINVFPDGKTFVDVDAIRQQLLDTGREAGDSSVENFENGRVTDGTIIGTNGDGVSDSDERNIFGHAAYDHEIEFYSSAPDVVIAGNYFGVGVDGISTAPLSTNAAPDFAELGGTASVRVGSNGDGVSDELEGNLIDHTTGSRFVVANATAPIVARRNQLRRNNFKAIPFADNDNAQYSAYYAPYLQDVNQGAVPILRHLTNGVLHGTFPAASAAYPFAVIDLYLVDPVALENTNYWPLPVVHPMTWLGTYTDNSPGDLDLDSNEFSIDVSGFGLSPTTYVAVAVSYSSDANLFNAANAVTSPMSNPIAERTALHETVRGIDTVELSWLASEGAYVVQATPTFAPFDWLESIGDRTYVSGRNLLLVSFDPFADAQFFRLISQ